MRAKSIALLGVLLLGAGNSAESESGTVCVAPHPEGPTRDRKGSLCASGQLSLKIDDQQAAPWPVKESLKIGGLDLAVSHLVVIACAGKAQQSFKFRFSEFRSKKLCLFVDDFYRNAQLWEDKQSPWCKCK